jgi:hypothetical protein
LLSFSVLAQNGNNGNKGSNSQGAINGASFQQLQEVLNASSDALAAAVSANTSNIEANSAAIAAEEAARQAEDAALLAKFAADLALEILARMEGDLALADALAAEELARIEGIDVLGTRIEALETGSSQNIPEDSFNEISYEETPDFDFTGLRNDILTLDYQPGEWLYMDSTHAGSGLTSAICTSHPSAYSVLIAFVMGGSQTADVTSSMTFVLAEGSNTWNNDSATMIAQLLYLRAFGLNMHTQLINRADFGFGPEFEVSTHSGYALGSTSVLRASANRMAACGF